MDRNFFKAIILLVTLLFLVACSDRDSPGKRVFKVAHNGSEHHPFQIGYEAFGKALSDHTHGQYSIEIFPNSQLGSEEEATEMVKLGVIASTASSAASLGPFVPEIDVLNFPFIFRDLEHFYGVLDGPIGKRLGEKIEQDLNMIVLGWWFAGVRNVWNKRHPVIDPDDLDGLKIRVIGSAIVLDAFDTLGAQATTMSFGELYSATQQGVLDGAESDNTDLLFEKFYEVTQFVSTTQHLYLAVPVTFSKKKFDHLPVAVQQAVIDAGRESVELQRAAMQKNNKDAYQDLLDLGLIYNDVDDDRFRETVQSGGVYERNADRVGGIRKIEEIVEFGKE